MKYTDKEFEKIYAEAKEAGHNALVAATPAPMIVVQHKDPLNDDSPVAKSWYVSEGACGFAWVHVKGNTAFGRWLKKTGVVDRPAYYGEYDIWVSEGGQSVERKEAYAGAFASVLKKYGIDAYSDSRLD